MFLSLIVYLAFGLSCIHALSLPQLTEKSSPSVISLDLELQEPELLKRKFEMTDFESTPGRYMVTFFLGSNKQKVRALLDSSSFTLNLYKNQYSPKKLTTSKDLKTPFTTKYVDNMVTGKRYEDSFLFPGGSSVNLQFGLINKKGVETDAPFGLAVGPDKKQSLVWLLKQANKIGRAQYSLYMDHATKKGKLILGGVDLSKFSEVLTKNPMTLPLGSINLVNIEMGGKRKTINKNIYFDCGSESGLLDATTYDWLAKLFKLKSNPNDLPLIDCNQPANKFVKFTFDKSDISIPYSLFLLKRGPNNCVFPFIKKDKNLVGTWLMKHMYASFDYADNTVAIVPYKPVGPSHVVSM